MLQHRQLISFCILFVFWLSGSERGNVARESKGGYTVMHGGAIAASEVSAKAVMQSVFQHTGHVVDDRPVVAGVVEEEIYMTEDEKKEKEKTDWKPTPGGFGDFSEADYWYKPVVDHVSRFHLFRGSTPELAKTQAWVAMCMFFRFPIHGEYDKVSFPVAPANATDLSRYIKVYQNARTGVQWSVSMQQPQLYMIRWNDEYETNYNNAIFFKKTAYSKLSWEITWQYDSVNIFFTTKGSPQITLKAKIRKPATRSKAATPDSYWEWEETRALPLVPGQKGLELNLVEYPNKTSEGGPLRVFEMLDKA